MKRALWIALVLVAAAAAATALLQSEPPKAQADIEAPFSTAETALDDVQVRHEFVTIDPPVPAQPAATGSVVRRQPFRSTSPRTDL